MHRRWADVSTNRLLTCFAPVNLTDPPKGFITAVEHSSTLDVLVVASVLGEVCVYADPAGRPLEGATLPWRRRFADPVVAVVCLEETVLVVHPRTVSAVKIAPASPTGDYDVRPVPSLALAPAETGVYLHARADEAGGVLVLGTSSGTLALHSVPDMAVLDTAALGAKLQRFDVCAGYVVVALGSGANRLLDVSCRRLVALATQDAGFKYPVTTDLRILAPAADDVAPPPHRLVYAQAGLEGKVAVVTTEIEPQTEPTVTVTTAATTAPVSSSCTNPAGLVVAGAAPQRFIFKAHRSRLSASTVLVRPVYSLGTVGRYLLTSGYGGGEGPEEAAGNGGKIGTGGSICLWDVASKKRVKLCRGLPFNVVRTASWRRAGIEHVVCGCSDDIYKNMPVPVSSKTAGGAADSVSAGASDSVLVLVKLAAAA